MKKTTKPHRHGFDLVGAWLIVIERCACGATRESTCYDGETKRRITEPRQVKVKLRKFPMLRKRAVTSTWVSGPTSVSKSIPRLFKP